MDSLTEWLLFQFNNWVAETPASFSHALWLVDRLPCLLVAGVTAALWFVGEPGALPIKPGGLIRLDSRRRVLLILAAMALSFLLSWFLQIMIFHPRPLVDMPLQAPIQPEAWQTLRTSLAGQSGFPSYQMTLLFVLVTGIFSFNRLAGGLAGLVGGYFGTLQIGLGLCWPSDVLAGALIGVLVTSLALVSQSRLRGLLTPLVVQFEYHQALTYSLGFLVLFDLSQKFAALSGLLGMLAYALNL